MSESKNEDDIGYNVGYNVDIDSSHVMGFGIQNVDGDITHIDLEGELLRGQRITLTPIGNGKCRVTAEYEGKINPEKLIALTVYNTTAWKRKKINGKSQAVLKKKGGCFPKIIAIGAVGVAVTVALSSCIKGCMAQPVEPTQPTEAIVQETTMPAGPEYYEATVSLREDVGECGYLYDDIINPWVFQDIYDELYFEIYNDYIGKIDEGISELTRTSYSIDRLSDLENELEILYGEYANQIWNECDAQRKAIDLRDGVSDSNPKHEMYDRQVTDIEKQLNRTRENFYLIDHAYGVVVHISKAHEDLMNGENYVKDVDFSFSCSGETSVYDTIDYTTLSTSGTIKSEYSESGKSQEELAKQIIEGLEGYDSYTEDDIDVRINIVDDQGEEVDYMVFSGTKADIIEDLKLRFDIQESSIENDGNDNIQLGNETETGKAAFFERDVKEVVAQQKTTRLRRTWNKFTHWLHRGPDRNNETR